MIIRHASLFAPLALPFRQKDFIELYLTFPSTWICSLVFFLQIKVVPNILTSCVQKRPKRASLKTPPPIPLHCTFWFMRLLARFSHEPHVH